MNEPRARAPMVMERTQTSRPRSALFAFTGGFLIVVSLVVGVLGWLVLDTLSGHERDFPDTGAKLPELAVMAMQRRAWFPIVPLPALVCGFVLILEGFAGARRVGRGGLPPRGRWLMLAAGSLWLVVCFLIILYCFIMFLAPMYEYQAL